MALIVKNAQNVQMLLMAELTQNFELTKFVHEIKTNQINQMTQLTQSARKNKVTQIVKVARFFSERSHFAINSV